MIATRYGLQAAAQMAGEYYNLRCPISSDAKHGNSWAEVH
tara:strand:+ start:662 stop:781 length:120 start_codon:yes stop_codon:yes gene_type:complete